MFGSPAGDIEVSRSLMQWCAMALTLGVMSACQSPAQSGAAGDSGPSNVPAAVLNQAEPIPRDEALSASGNSPSYEVFGETYHLLATSANYSATGVASWYGRKFHGRLTASGEKYDMYALTAAHRTLPLPTFVRVTNLENNKSVVVRVNDRGPFVDDRLIDLSYGAAAKLGMVDAGTARVKVVGLSGVPGTTSAAAPTTAVGAQQPHIVGLPYRVPTPILSTPAADTSTAASSTTASSTTAPSTTAPSTTAPSTTASSTTAPSTTASSTTAPSTTAPNRVPVPPVVGGDYLQVGAFASIDAARRLSQQLEGLAEETAVFITQLPADNLYRVRLGPFATLEGATRVSQRIQNQLRLIPVSVD